MSTSPYIDPQMEPVLAMMRERLSARPHMTEIAIEEMRERAHADLAFWNEDPPMVPRVETFDIPGPFGRTPLRLYDPAPASKSPRPVLVYFHGGGWVIGNLETEDRSLRDLALASGCAIISVEYVLAPEHKFPDPVRDGLSAIRWVAHHAGELGLDADRLALGGASAGANLALAAALSLKENGEALVRFLLLFYGVFSGTPDSESYGRFGNGEFGLDRQAMEYFYTLYLDSPADRQNPLVSPVNAELGGLPPVYLSVAELDPLRDDSLRLAARLEAAGVPVETRRYDGVIHGFTLMGRMVEAANRAIKDAGNALVANLA